MLNLLYLFLVSLLLLYNLLILQFILQQTFSCVPLPYHSYSIYFNFFLFIFRSLNSSSWSEVYRSVSFQSSVSKGTTTIIWNLHTNPHDFSSLIFYEESRKVLSSNIIYLSAICVWLSSIFYIGAYFSNFDSWLMSLTLTSQSSQVASDVFGQGNLNNDFSYSIYGIQVLSGVFNVWLSWGVVSLSQLKFLSVLSALAAGLFLGGNFLSMHLVVPISSLLKLSPSLFFKSAILLSLGMISWSGHILHVSVPTLRFLSFGVSPDLIPSPIQFLFLPISIDFFPDDYSLFPLLYTAAHHLFGGLACLSVSTYLLRFKNLVNTSSLSWDYLIASNLLILSASSFLVAHTTNLFTVYPFLSTDLPVLYLLFTHHVWIAAFLLSGSFAHFTISYLRSLKGFSLRRLIFSIFHHRELILFHLSWVCIFLGLHSFGLLVHNDTLEALGRVDDIFSDYSIQLKPLFCDLSLLDISATSNLYNFYSISPVPHSLSGTSEFIISHIHAFNIHVSVLISLKGILFARSSRFVADKISLGFRYPCDGPGKGGSCQISPWDHIFLILFWLYNLSSVLVFDFFWNSQSDSWLQLKEDYITHPCAGDFSANSNSVNGWLKNFLWSQASQVIQDYATINYLYSLLFLVSHFLQVFSLMLLFSGRGYWQEFIKSVVWSHLKLKVVLFSQLRALSISQGRVIGVTHFLVGKIGCTWSFSLSRIVTLF